jgi:hypothetical protein
MPDKRRNSRATIDQNAEADHFTSFKQNGSHSPNWVRFVMGARGGLFRRWHLSF